jgi:hypothetical protein
VCNAFRGQGALPSTPVGGREVGGAETARDAAPRVWQQRTVRGVDLSKSDGSLTGASGAGSGKGRDALRVWAGELRYKGWLACASVSLANFLPL